MNTTYAEIQAYVEIIQTCRKDTRELRNKWESGNTSNMYQEISDQKKRIKTTILATRAIIKIKNRAGLPFLKENKELWELNFLWQNMHHIKIIR